MKLCKKILVIILAVFMVLGSYPFSSSAASVKNKVKSIKVISTPANILVVKKGQKYKLKVKVKADGKVSKKVRYFSANESIVTVSNLGRVKGIRKGSTKITVKSAGEEELSEIVNVKVKNCTIKNGTEGNRDHCMAYSEKVTYDGCTFTSFAGRNAKFDDCTVHPKSYMNNKLYFYGCTFKPLDGSDEITLNLNAPRDSERLFEDCKFEGKVTVGANNFHNGIFRNCEFDDVEFKTVVDSLDGEILFENCKIKSSAENLIWTGENAANTGKLFIKFKDCEITHTGANLIGFFSLPSENSRILFEDCTIKKNSGSLIKWLTNYFRAQLIDKISVDVIFKNTTVERSLVIDNAVDSDHARVVFE